MTSDLLLNTSAIFDNANLIDNIRQSYIDINEESDKEEIQNLVNQAISYHEKDIDEKTANELFALMEKCFSYFPEFLLPSFNTILQKSRVNSKFIITTATVLSHLIHEQPKLKLPDYSSFVNDALNEIRSQNLDEDISIFGHQIPPQTKYNLVVNFILCSNITQESISSFLPYIFSVNRISNIPSVFKFIKLLSEKNLLETIPDSIINNCDIIMKLSNESSAFFLPIISDQIFIEYFPRFEEFVGKNQYLSSLYSKNFILKCAKLDIKLQSILLLKLIIPIQPSDITPEICGYISQYRISFSPTRSRELLECPCVEMLFDNLSSVSILPEEMLIKILKKETNIESNDFASSQFYVDAYSFFNKNDSRFRQIDLIKYFFMKYVEKERSNQVIDDMIFSLYPPTDKGALFLKHFLNEIDDDYRKSFDSKEHMKMLLEKVIEKKVTPPIEFAKIIDDNVKLEMLKQPDKNSNPLLLYLNCYSPPENHGSTDDSLIEIKVLPQTKQSEEQFFEYIKCHDEDNVDSDFISPDLSEEYLSLASCALNYAKNKNRIKVKGLNKETVLPFFAAAAVFYAGCKEDSNSSDAESSELLSLLIDGANSVCNNQSPTTIYYVDKIIQLHRFLSQEARRQFVQILIQFLMNNQYFANKQALLLLALNNSKFIQVDNAIEYMLKHSSEFAFKTFNIANDHLEFDHEKITKLMIDYLLNPSLTDQELINMIYLNTNILKLSLKLENPQNLLKIFHELINEKKYDESLLVSTFLADCGIVSELHEYIKNDENIPKDIKSDLYSTFSYNEINEEEFISILLSDKNPETNNSLIEALFNLMMKEKQNRIGYLICVLEKLEKNLYFKPELLLQVFNAKYEAYKDDFIEALDHVFVLHPIKNTFVIRASCKPFDYQISERTQKIVSILYEAAKENPEDYRPFYFLKCIACSFPFVFSSNPQEILDHALPKLNDYHLIYDEKPKDESKEQEEKRIRKMKTSFAAFSFFNTAINSVKSIDYISAWYMTHYKELTKSQIYCFNLILTVLFSSFHKNEIKALLYKYNFAEMFSYLLKIEMDDSMLDQNFNYICYLLISLFYYGIFADPNTFALLSYTIDRTDAIFGFFRDGHLSTIHDQAIFAPYSDLISILPEIQKQNKIIFDFIHNVEDKRIFWINFNDSVGDPLEQEKVESFLNHYKRMIPVSEIDESPLPDRPNEPTAKITTYLLQKPTWVKNYILNVKIIPIVAEHHKVLVDTIEQMHKIQSTGKLSDDDDTPDCLYDDYDHGPFLGEKIYNENLIELIIEKCKTKNSQPLAHLYNTVQSISISEMHLKYMLSIISKQLETYCNLENNCSAETIDNMLLLLNPLLDILQKVLSISGDRYAIEIIGNTIIEKSLQPSYRTNHELLFLISKILKLILPIQSSVGPSTHLIGFMLLTKNENMIIEAIQLCSKYDINDLKHMEIIQVTFDNELNEENHRIKVINSFLDNLPSVGMSRKLEMMEKLEALLKLYETSLKSIETQNSSLIDELGLNVNTSAVFHENDASERDISFIFGNNDLAENNKVTNFICVLLDFLAPMRNLQNSFNMSDSIASNERRQNPNYKFYPIPDFIYNSSPKFWQYFDDNREIIDYILLKKFQKNKMPNQIDPTNQLNLKQPLFSSKLVSQYPECFSFEFRQIYFRQKMQMRIIHQISLSLKVDPENIFLTSFIPLIRLPAKNWFLDFKIIYQNQMGSDLGGLMKDWLTKLSDAMFNPDSDLFQCLEDNENYIIRQKKDEELNDVTLLMYRFAGMIIARALIQGELITAHLTRSLLKLILHHEVKLSDVEDLGQNIYNSLMYIKENDIGDGKDLNIAFEETMSTGQTVELKENGGEIIVNEENKEEYLSLKTDFLLRDSFLKQAEHFCGGFDSLIDHNDIRIFTPNELCLLICGVANVDVEDLRKNIRILPPYDQDTPIIKMFFNVISKWDDTNLTKLLMFITGSSRMPVAGFKFFVDIKKPITIAHDPDKDHLPIAHTCINTIELPEYRDEDELNRKLLISIDDRSFNLK